MLSTPTKNLIKKDSDSEAITDNLVGAVPPKTNAKDKFQEIENLLDQAQLALSEAREEPRAARLAADTAEATCVTLRARITTLMASQEDLQRTFEQQRKDMAKHAEKIPKALEESKLQNRRLTNELERARERSGTRESVDRQREILDVERETIAAEREVLETRRMEIQNIQRRATRRLKRALD
jgi:nucleotide-binding universal stress UspA family protein